MFMQQYILLFQAIISSVQMQVFIFKVKVILKTFNIDVL